MPEAESSAAGNKQGSYTITDADGPGHEGVDYVADAAGFRDFRQDQQTGTALSAPASAAIVSPYAPPVAPVAPVVVPQPWLPLTPLAAPGISAYSSIVGHGAGLYAPGISKTIF
ncbi:hypothetical protein AVEN_245394-1 [Araneus ventricosus]|uniref:Uncharacterized protein n=1 Tax=Araneus ventricosus TaxID=182803 RepID=A0A4Y2UVZ6_ARAVE|nr:hypothetical protein AVEN_245394-1 [Araneus ventricosus]